MPLAEMQLLESRKFQIEEICRIYGVPPFMVGHTEKTTSWGSGVESMGIGFVRYTLRPTLTRFETELNRKLFRQGRKCIRFDTADLERADIKTMMEAIRVGLGRAGERPIITQNEGRRMMRLADMPGGDTLEPTPAANPQPSPGA
jgi:HK97 family phage portal protein